MDPADAVELYTKQCCLNVSAQDLAVMGATLADGGINPTTKKRVVDASVCHYALAVMTTAGLYETSGDWLYDIGLPGKSGIGGGIVTVSPGKGGLGTFSPLLDNAGNSVKGQLVAKVFHRWAGSLVSQPAAWSASAPLRCDDVSNRAETWLFLIQRSAIADRDLEHPFALSLSIKKT
jgi:glutaminase